MSGYFLPTILRKRRRRRADTYNPLASLDNVQLAIFPHLTRSVWQANRLDNASADTNVVAYVDSQAGNYHPFRQTSGGREPLLGSDGTYGTFLDFGSGAGVRKFLEGTNTTGAFNFFHNENTWSVAFAILPNVDGNTQHILTNADATGGERGIYIARDTSNRLNIYAQNGSASSGKVTTATITQALGWQVVILTCNNKALTIEIGSQAAETHTFTQAADTTNAATAILRIGSDNDTPATDTYLQSKLAFMLITSDVLTAAEKESIRSWRPTRSNEYLTRVIGTFAANGAMKLSGCKRWLDFTDKTKMFQTTVAAATAVTAPGDPIGAIVDKAQISNSSSMNLSRNGEYDGTASKRPILTAAATLGVTKDAPVWDGVAGPDDTGADDAIVIGGTGDGATLCAKTQIIIAINTDNAADINSGSHYGTAGSEYWVMTSNEYQGNPALDDKRFVHHPSLAIIGNETSVVTNDAIPGNGIAEIIVIRRHGTQVETFFDGRATNRGTVTTSQVLTFPTSMGPAVNAGFALKGTVYHFLEYNHYVPDEYLSPLITEFATDLGVTLTPGP